MRHSRPSTPRHTRRKRYQDRWCLTPRPFCDGVALQQRGRFPGTNHRCGHTVPAKQRDRVVAAPTPTRVDDARRRRGPGPGASSATDNAPSSPLVSTARLHRRTDHNPSPLASVNGHPRVALRCALADRLARTAHPPVRRMLVRTFSRSVAAPVIAPSRTPATVGCRTRAPPRSANGEVLEAQPSESSRLMVWNGCGAHGPCASPPPRDAWISSAAAMRSQLARASAAPGGAVFHSQGARSSEFWGRKTLKPLRAGSSRPTSRSSGRRRPPNPRSHPMSRVVLVLLSLVRRLRGRSRMSDVGFSSAPPAAGLGRGPQTTGPTPSRSHVSSRL